MPLAIERIRFIDHGSATIDKTLYISRRPKVRTVFSSAAAPATTPLLLAEEITAENAMRIRPCEHNHSVALIVDFHENVGYVFAIVRNEQLVF
jgi:hypothetical protein